MIRLMLGDCLERMKEIADGTVDLTVTSPPYDNLRTYNDSLNDWTESKWQAVIEELHRVTKPGGVVVWVVGDATIKGSETGTSFRQALYALQCGFRLHDTMIYEKAGAGASGSNYGYWQAWEFMFVWSKGRPETFNPIQDRPNQFRPGRSHSSGGRRASDGETKATTIRRVGEMGRRTNVWRIPAGYRVSTLDMDAFKHPAIFPEALARDHILSWSNEGNTVLDPFLGSGTTGKMAVLNNRSFIGIERDESYFAIAEKRITEAQGSGLFLMAAE